MRFIDRLKARLEASSEPPDPKRLRAQGDVTGLIGVLRYKRDEPSEGVRRAEAARALKALGAEQAIDPLIDVVERDPVASVRIAAALSLGSMRARRAVNALIRMVKYDPDDWDDYRIGRQTARAAAARALIEIGDPRGLDVVSREGVGKVRRQAEEALSGRGDPRGQEAVERRAAARRTASNQEGARRAAAKEAIAARAALVERRRQEGLPSLPSFWYVGRGAQPDPGLFWFRPSDDPYEADHEVALAWVTGRGKRYEHPMWPGGAQPFREDWRRRKTAAAATILDHYFGKPLPPKVVASFAAEVIDLLLEPPFVIDRKTGSFKLAPLDIEVWAARHGELVDPDLHAGARRWR